MNDFLVKSEEISSPKYGNYPGARPIKELINKGIIILDKPSGPTSHQVTAWVRDMLGVKKAGHSGTLDPKVTGVLVITLGKARKIMPVLMGMDKEYIALMELHKEVDEKELQKTLEKFKGKIKQTPPKKSAVKREERIREIYEMKILDREERRILLDIKCQKGTYIRKLIHDIGEKIGSGAHMKELRRTKVGYFDEKNSVKLQDLKDAHINWKKKGDEKIRDYIKPVEFGTEHLKKIVIKDSAVDALANGAPLGAGGVSRIERGIEKGEEIAILTEKGELVSLGTSKMSSKEMLKSGKGRAAKIDSVLIKRGLYPKMWGKTNSPVGKT